MSAKEEECRQQAEIIKEKDGVIKEKDEDLKDVRQQLVAFNNSEAVARGKSATIQEQQAEIHRLRDQMAAQQAEIQRLRDQPAVSQKVS